MTDGQYFYFAAIAAVAIAALAEHLWRRRWWLRVIEQDGERNERRVRPSEATELLSIEKMLHEGTGWTCRQYGPGILRCQKNGVVRWIWIAPPKGLRRAS